MISKSRPDESLKSLREASKSLTLLLAGWLAEKVMLREITSRPVKNCTMMIPFTCYVRIIGSCLSIQSSCTPPHGTMLLVKVKGKGHAAGWPRSLPTRNRSNPSQAPERIYYEGHRLGLCPADSGFRPIGSLTFFCVCKLRRMNIGRNTSRGLTRL